MRVWVAGYMGVWVYACMFVWEGQVRVCAIGMLLRLCLHVSLCQTNHSLLGAKIGYANVQ